jgi:hypothetical protein
MTPAHIGDRGDEQRTCTAKRPPNHRILLRFGNSFPTCLSTDRATEVANASHGNAGGP